MRPSTMVLACVVLTSAAVPAMGANPPDFETRVAAQTAIEGVYWRHRIWPPDNPAPKPALDQVLPASVVRARVEDYLLESQALERVWGRPIRNEDLAKEVARIYGSSRAPEVLQEIVAALGNDADLAAECLARPLLADRLIRAAYARDPRVHGPRRTAIERVLARHPSVADAGSLGGEYGLAVWTAGRDRSDTVRTSADARIVRMDPATWDLSVSRLRAGLGAGPGASLPIGVFGSLQEDDDSFFVNAVLEQSDTRLRVATVVWRKVSFDTWWARARVTLDPVAAIAVSGPFASTEASPDIVAAAACTPDTWTAVTLAGGPSPREAFTGVWTGAEMIVWGGYNVTTGLDTNTGGRYNPATDSWTATPTTGAPDQRDTHTAVWSGTKMVVWGGGSEAFVPKATGGRYDPTTNTWAPTTTTGAPSAREYHTAVWSGSRMVVWGGWDGSRDTDTGGRYDPTADAWTTTARGGSVPTARDSHSAVWTGAVMVVWGGVDDNVLPQATGGRYDPVGNAWSATNATGAPTARWLHSAVWTGSRMILWGGFDGSIDQNTGALYDPSADAWTATSTAGAPSARDQHVAVWTGTLNEMDIWGGQDDAANPLKSGGRYNPTTGAWSAISGLAGPTAGRYAAAVWTGSEMICWGGWNQVDLNSGARYCSGACASSAPGGGSVVSLSTQTGGALVSWTAVNPAAAYDLVRGTLGSLRTGDFTASTQACLADDQVDRSTPDSAIPAVGDGFWYLVRGLSCGGSGTYDDVDGQQVGGRDAEIAASAGRCP